MPQILLVESCCFLHKMQLKHWQGILRIWLRCANSGYATQLMWYVVAYCWEKSATLTTVKEDGVV